MKQKWERKFYLPQFRSITSVLSSNSEFLVLINHMAEGICRTFEVQGACIMLYDEGEKQLFNVGSYGISEQYLTKGPVLVNEQYSSFFTGKPVLIEDLQHDSRIHYPKEAEKENLHSMLSIPIKSRGAITGTIRMYHSEPIHLHDQDVESISVLAELLGLVIEYNGLRNFLEEVKGATRNLPSRLLS
jgi:transcriptional regulator with GAF, ATPase, and Fis domain